MGGGKWDSSVYNTTKKDRADKGVDDFAYTQTAAITRKVHENLDPLRINKKPFNKLESRDSVEHPNSHAVLMTLDVTGSNSTRAKIVQGKLPLLMGMLTKFLPDVQVALWANDDYRVSPTCSVQCSDFESDIRIDEHLRNLFLVENGGGNGGESYDLLMYAAARKTVLDCVEKRGQKGYLFMYADEPFFTSVRKDEVKAVFGDAIEADIPIADIITEAKQNYHIFVLWPAGSTYQNAYDQYVKLFGKDCVVILEQPDSICELVTALVGLSECKLDPEQVALQLVENGMTNTDAKAIVTTATSSCSTEKKSKWEGGKEAGAARL